MFSGYMSARELRQGFLGIYSKTRLYSINNKLSDQNTEISNITFLKLYKNRKKKVSFLFIFIFYWICTSII